VGRSVVENAAELERVFRGELQAVGVGAGRKRRVRARCLTKRRKREGRDAKPVLRVGSPAAKRNRRLGGALVSTHGAKGILAGGSVPGRSKLNGFVGVEDLPGERCVGRRGEAGESRNITEGCDGRLRETRHDCGCGRCGSGRQCRNAGSAVIFLRPERAD